MFKNKKIMSIAAFALVAISLTGGIVSAFAASAKDKTSTVVQSEKGSEDLQAEARAEARAEASKVGIDTTGMTDEQVETASRSYKERQRHENLLADASRGGIDITGMTDTQIEAAILGIDTTGMTDEQIETAINSHRESVRFESMRVDASKMGIDTTGMTDEQVEAALNSYKESGSHENPHAPKAGTTSTIDEQADLESIRADASKMGIDTTGMTYEQIVTALNSYKESH